MILWTIVNICLTKCCIYVPSKVINVIKHVQYVTQQYVYRHSAFWRWMHVQQTRSLGLLADRSDSSWFRFGTHHSEDGCIASCNGFTEGSMNLTGRRSVKRVLAIRGSSFASSLQLYLYIPHRKLSIDRVSLPTTETSFVLNLNTCICDMFAGERSAS